MNLLKKILRALLLAPVALLLLFEEWGWEQLAAGFAALGRLPWWGQLERLITRLPPWAALLVFGIPVGALVPIKLLALYLFGRGHVMLGLGLVLAAKLTGTALAARLFQLTQPALMQLKWFARLYTPWKNWKDRLLEQVRSSWPWRMAHQLKVRVSVHMKVWRIRIRAALRSAGL
ncbi:MAG TPA: hypothetical protein DCP03_11145 [Polaromonas sp.]|uniref:hypothetical protein n=1 Tax=Polaromonas sp. UBA4122 TaxID=1947074 RepID=UPI000ED80D80|nr:hypothetical protein [Polaromonas sp. UBA4122]HAL38628.1 hypothetical protein [Polaromonas sp.]